MVQHLLHWFLSLLSAQQSTDWAQTAFQSFEQNISEEPSRVSVSDYSLFLNIRQLSWFVPCDGCPVFPTPTLFRGMNKACLGKLASGILTVCWAAVSNGGGLGLWEPIPTLTSALLVLIPPCFSSSLLAAGCNLSHSHANNTDSLPSTVGGQ